MPRADKSTIDKSGGANLRPKSAALVPRLKKQWELQTMVIPGVAFMIIFAYMPMYGLVIAFQNFTMLSPLGSASWVGLRNFEIIVGDSFFWDAARNTLAISLLKLAIGFVAPIILAVQIFEMKIMSLKKFIQTVSYLPYFLSWVVLGGMMISWLSTNGLLNNVLDAFGLAGGRQNWLLSQGNYWWIATLSDVWKNAGWNSILYLAVLSQVDPTYYEAAKLDGASRLATIRYITLPSMRYIISFTFILSVSGILGSNLDQTLVLQNVVNQPRSEVINSYVFRMGIAQGNFSYATAVGLGISVISLVLLVVAHKVTKKLNDGESVL